MEFKKKTLIWETNTEPPKNYIWIKEDGKAYEYNNSTRKWEESKTLPSGKEDTEDAFPYEWICPDDFSITIQPNDWDTDDESEFYSINIDVDIPIISSCILESWYCNNVRRTESGDTTITTPWGHDVYVYLDKNDEKIYKIVILSYDSSFNPSEVVPFTLNFTDLLFIGNKK